MKKQIKATFFYSLILTLGFSSASIESGAFSGAGGSPSYCPAYNIFLNTGPIGVVAEDFNLDGKIDLATANRDSDDLTVLLGDGAGNFTAAANSPFGAGDTPFALATGDFNADGKPDLVAANANGNTFSPNAVTVLLGDGGGNFDPAVVPPFPGWVQATAVAADDFNADGKLDIAAANASYGEASIFLGNGAGGFAAPAGYPLNTFIASSIKVSDFNADGNLDLATSNVASDDVTVLLGDGAGAFSPAPSSPFAVGDFPYSLTVADYSGDGRPDMVVTNFYSKTISVLLGDGSGEFARTDVPIGGTVIDAETGDFNLDGNPDLALSNTRAPTSSTVGILLGDGVGGFGPITNLDVNGSTATSLAVADLNEDNRLDLVSANLESDDLSVFLSGCGSCAGPEISNVSVSPDVLLVPNHKMREVTVNYGVTGGCGAVACALSVTSNEPASGTGDGDASPDWEVVDAHHVRLRAERSGAGTGRIYSITITCTDESGMTTVRAVMVRVPHS